MDISDNLPLYRCYSQIFYTQFWVKPQTLFCIKLTNDHIYKKKETVQVGYYNNIKRFFDMFI